MFHLRLDGEPTQAIFDPGRVLLAARKIDKPEPMWIAELAGATLAIDRARGRAGAREARRSRRRAGARDRAREGQVLGGARRRGRSALGMLRTPTARDG